MSHGWDAAGTRLGRLDAAESKHHDACDLEIPARRVPHTHTSTTYTTSTHTSPTAESPDPDFFLLFAVECFGYGLFKDASKM